MNAMAPPRPTELHRCHLRLATGPAAARQARRQVEGAICAWDIPVDPDVAVLLTSELVTNAITHEAAGTVTLAITCSGRQLRVDVFDSCGLLPVVAEAPADAETGRGLMLVATLSAEWGFYRTPAGKAVYFTLAFPPDLARGSYVGTVSRNPPGRSPSPPHAPAIPAARRTVPAESYRRNGAQG